MADKKPAGKPKSFASISMQINDQSFHEEGEPAEVQEKFERWLAKTLKPIRRTNSDRASNEI